MLCVKLKLDFAPFQKKLDVNNHVYLCCVNVLIFFLENSAMINMVRLSAAIDPSKSYSLGPNTCMRVFW